MVKISITYSGCICDLHLSEIFVIKNARRVKLIWHVRQINVQKLHKTNKGLSSQATAKYHLCSPFSLVLNFGSIWLI